MTRLIGLYAKHEIDVWMSEGDASISVYADGEIPVGKAVIIRPLEAMVKHTKLRLRDSCTSDKLGVYHIGDGEDFHDSTYGLVDGNYLVTSYSDEEDSWDTVVDGKYYEEIPDVPYLIKEGELVAYIEVLEYEFNGDFKADMHAYIDYHYEQYAMLNTSRKTRIETADAIIEAYYEQTGILPDSAHLERLGSLILREEMTDTNRMKIRDNDYPFHTEDQERRRAEGEVSFVWAESVGVDGKNYQLPTRENLRKLR